VNKFIDFTQRFGPGVARIAFLAAMLMVGLSGLSSAGAAGPDTQVGNVLNSMLLPICGVLVVVMAVGFAMLEAGIVRSKLIVRILPKYLVLLSIASIMVVFTTWFAPLLFA
jgi:Amt family ammonium transporter